MGFFSWKTQDTNKSIPNKYSNRKTFRVYMIDNKGNRWIEDDYEGYGRFGGKDFYELLAEMNGITSNLKGQAYTDYMRGKGIDLAFKNNPSGVATKGVFFPNLILDADQWSYEKSGPDSDENQGYFYDDDEDEEYDNDNDYDEDEEYEYAKGGSTSNMKNKLNLKLLPYYSIAENINSVQNLQIYDEDAFAFYNANDRCNVTINYNDASKSVIMYQEWDNGNMDDDEVNLLTFENYLSNTKMEDGGKTQGYDDREDERLGMKYGKLSSKHLNSTHARRDDARFEERMADGGYMAKGGMMSDEKMTLKLQKEFEGKDLFDDEIVDEYVVKQFDYSEDDDKIEKFIRMKKNKFYVVPFDNQDDSYYYILVPKDKMADGGYMAKGGDTDEPDDEMEKLVSEHYKEAKRNRVKITNFGWSQGDDYIVSKTTERKDGSDVLTSEISNGVVEHDWDSYARGGKLKSNPAKFRDKVKAISKKLAGTKVPKKYKKDYGATYDKQEANTAARRISGAKLAELRAKLAKKTKSKKK